MPRHIGKLEGQKAGSLTHWFYESFLDTNKAVKGLMRFSLSLKSNNFK